MRHAFRVSRIRKKRIRNSKTVKWIAKLPWVKIFFVGISVFLVFKGSSWMISKINISSIFSFLSGIVAQELKMDESGRTNILLLGAGGEGHQGKDLTDTIIIASYYHPKNTVTLVSLPRDLYAHTERFGNNRINGFLELAKEKTDYELEAIDQVKQEMEKLFNINLHYSIKADFVGLEKIVDELGGIDVYVEEEIDDPFYPDDKSYGYNRFIIHEGQQHLDGATALKYARSRKTSSDFNRAGRQQKVLKAIKEKAVQEKIISSPSRIKDLLNAVNEHVATDFPIREMIMLATKTKDLNDDRIFSYVLHDDPTQTGGFLYTPLRELYGGAFVLVPASDNFTSIQNFINLITLHSTAISLKTPIQILNGTKKAGIAAETKMILKRHGFLVSRFGNARSQDIEKTVIYYKPEIPPDILEPLKKIIPGQISTDIPQKYLEPPYESDAEIIVELGADFLSIFKEMNIFNNIVPLTPTQPTAETAI